jgi:asparagine N-glycosylation enzyme membrane subunit Stt3
MTTATITRTNPAARLLVIGGALSALVGAILWTTGANQSVNDQEVADLTRDVGVTAVPAAVAADQMMIWWGIALVILSVLMVLAWVIIRAARR